MADQEPQIIIRKRRQDTEDDHHGGVWKLAFADFMTAMMAFFLVMWLINSTSKETKAAIVQYFNPVQLIDANPAQKGLRDPKEKGQGKSLQQTDASLPTGESGGETESPLHNAPLETLDKIAKLDPPGQQASPHPEQTPPAGAPRDSFDRAPRTLSPAAENPRKKEEAAAHIADRPATAKADAAAALKTQIDKILGKEAHAPKVEVKQVADGMLISLTDDARFSMFGVGSIEPKPQVVRIIGDIAKILSTKSGEVELRGHTDGRSYASSSYDNWRLSSDRATVVNYMLIRGGLPPARIGRIVGYADRQLRVPGDPMAPTNRRIEILLRGDGK